MYREWELQIDPDAAEDLKRLDHVRQDRDREADHYSRLRATELSRSGPARGLARLRRR
jgi:hypothetical protein